MKTTTSTTFSIVQYFMIIAAVACVASCGSSNVQQNLTAEERFDLGKKKFLDEDYLEAISEFEIVKLQFPGSSVADDAQYYLGECHYVQEEYLIAAEEYQALKRNMQASSLVPQAQYKIAMCYYNLSPESPMDQEYTKRAIEEFQTFIEYNPAHELAKDAAEKIKELNNRLAKKEFDSAELYMKMENYKSATMYFNLVVEKYHDTPFAEPALLGKVKSLIPRRKYDEAKQEIDKFLQKYPESSMKAEAQALSRDIEEHVKTKPSSVNTSYQ
jgi:outer membrane protein assembly factor BamD